MHMDIEEARRYIAAPSIDNAFCGQSCRFLRINDGCDALPLAKDRLVRHDGKVPLGIGQDEPAIDDCNHSVNPPRSG